MLTFSKYDPVVYATGFILMYISLCNNDQKNFIIILILLMKLLLKFIFHSLLISSYINLYT